jgi:acyl-CoA reductase-like NAD-dependent aldehyde dehydrogenase
LYHSKHSRALIDAHNAEMNLLAARTANEQGQVSLRDAGERLEASRDYARSTAEMLRKKVEEVDHLRAQKTVDEKKHATRRPIRGVSLLV